MLNYVLIFIVCIALALALSVGAIAMFRSQSYKKNYFLLMHSMIIVFLFGHLLELTSTSVEEAYSAIKILYVGSSFVTPLMLFFTADYCNTKIHPVFKVVLLVLALAMVLTMWTTKFHNLVYVDYFFSPGSTNYLDFTPGPLYSVLHVYPLFCNVLTLLVMLNHMRKWKSKYLMRLVILFICVCLPGIADAIYYVTVVIGVNVNKIYFTPHTMAIMSLCLYLGVVRVNVFEIISVATVTAMKNIREGFILVDEDNNYLASNPAAMKIFPGITELVRGESVFSAYSWPEELKDLDKKSVDLLIEYDVPRYFRASINPVFSRNKTLMAKMILIAEITDNVNLMKELENAAYTDSLTGLFNRKHFFSFANVEIERAQRMNQSMYAAMLDLDFFKRVNDTYGHAAGDLVLKSSAGVIRQTIRSYDLVGRFGGDEFIFLISALDSSEALNQMERVRENMENNSVFYEGTEIKIKCSIGLAKFLEGDTVESGVNRADKALYSAKDAGRNNVYLIDTI